MLAAILLLRPWERYGVRWGSVGKYSGHTDAMAKFALRDHKGFTLLELLAVMAIVAVLAGIVSVSVSGSGQTSKDTRSKGDATSIESALAGYLGSRGGVEVLVPKVATVLGRIEVKQVISTNWPENYISDTYSKVFPEGAISTVGSVTFLNSDGTLSDLTARGLLQGFNAIDFDVLFDGGFMAAVPKSVSETSQDFNNYLWLLEKSITAGGTGAVASREVAVFKLISVEEISGSDLVDLTYSLLFGGDFSDQHPVASIQTVTTDEDIPIRVILSGTDLESCELTFLIEEQPLNGDLTGIFDNLCVAGDPNTDSASVIYLPDPNFNGADSFSYSVIDGNGDDIASITVTINVVNDAPSFTIPTLNLSISADEDAVAQSVSGWVTDISAGPSDESGQTLNFVVTENDNPGLFSSGPAVSSSTGDLTYTPATNANGVANVTVVLRDTFGGADTSAPQPFTITVNAVNDPPVFTVTDQEVDEDSGAQSMSITGVSPGPSDEVLAGQTVSFTATSSPSGIISDPTISVSGASRTLSYTPVANQNGTVTITVVADDGQGANNNSSDTFNIIVTAVNDPPVFTVTDQEVDEDSGAQSMSITGVSPGPSDEVLAGQTVSFTATANPSGIISDPTISGSGASRTLSYTPVANQNGTVTITVVANDDQGANNTSSDTFKIIVTAVNDPPTATIDTTNRVSTSITFTGHGADVEDGDPMAVSALVWEIALTSAPGVILDTKTGVSTDTFTQLDSSASYTLTLTVTDTGNSTGADSKVFAGTVFQDTFDSETQRGNATTLANWTVTAGNVDVIGPDFANLYSGNGNYLDMAGCTNGTIQSSLLNLPPGAYRLSFEIGNNPDGLDNNRLQVTLAPPLVDENFNAQAALTLITRTFNVTTSTQASLVFKEIGDLNCGGTVLDDVLLTLLSAT